MSKSDKGCWDMQGYNDVDMKVIFAMTTQYNDDENENRPTEELLRTSMKEVPCSHANYIIADLTLDNIHRIIDNNDVELCDDGQWRSIDVFYFDRKTQTAFKIKRESDIDTWKRIETIYTLVGDGACDRIHKFLKDNDVRVDKP